MTQQKPIVNAYQITWVLIKCVSINGLKVKQFISMRWKKK